MVTTVSHTIGTSKDYTLVQSWENAGSYDLTAGKKWNANTFSGTFSAADESVTMSPSGATARCVKSDNSSYIVFLNVSGTPAAGDTVTGGTSGATCALTSLNDTGVIWQGLCANQTFTDASNQVVNIAGQTTSSTCYVELTTDTGCSFADNANKLTNALKYNASNGAAFSGNGNSIDVVIIQANYTRFSKIQVTFININAWCINVNSATNVWIDQVISFNNGTIFLFAAIRVKGTNAASATGFKASNCLFYARAIPCSIDVDTAIATTWYNCTFATPSDYSPGTVVTTKFGTNTFTNCTFFGNASQPIDNVAGASTNNVTYCATDYSTLSGTGNVTSLTYTAQFEGTTSSTVDYRVKTSGSGLAAGTDLSGGTPAITVDIVGTSRSGTYTIGAWQLAGGGGGGSPEFTKQFMLLGVG